MKKFFESSLRPSSANKKLVACEVGFAVDVVNSQYSEYSAFDDIYMRRYWCQPAVKQKLKNLGLVSMDEKRLIDPDKERMRLKSAKSRIAQAELQTKILQQKRGSKLTLEKAWLKRQLVGMIRRDSMKKPPY